MSEAPDFVIVGGRMGEEFVLYASTDLTDAQLRAERTKQEQQHTELGILHSKWSPMRTTLLVTMKSYVMVTGPSYAGCLAHLLREWSPDAGPVAVEQRYDGRPERVISELENFRPRYVQGI